LFWSSALVIEVDRQVHPRVSGEQLGTGGGELHIGSGFAATASLA
jgi:hypothetical protein